jgi:ectoine hydroxylase-related dioxygenase (phytanoyl-CoA dioxygenase family)
MDGLPESFLAKLASYREAYARDGAVLVPSVLDQSEMALARQMFDWSRKHPGQAAGEVTLGGPDKTVFIDTHSQYSRAYYLDILGRSAMPAIAAAVLGVDRLWYLGEQIFIKQGEEGSRPTPWHQDSDLPIDATGAIGLWMAFEPLDRAHGLEFVRGSHRGPELNPIASVDAEGTHYLYPNASHMAPFPDIDADRGAFDIVAWDYRPGDLILFHTLTIHGGATVPPGGERNTLCVRFVDEQVRYKPRPERALNGNLAAEAADFLWEGLEDGMPVHLGTRFEQIYSR